MAELGFELKGGKFYIWYTHLHKFMWIYNIWDQFENLKAIHLNTKWYLMQLYQKRKKFYKQKKLIHNIAFIYWDVSNMSDLFKYIYIYIYIFLEPKLKLWMKLLVVR